MVNISYRRAKDGMTCITKCPYGEDRMVGSIGCDGCTYHFMTMPGLRQVICRYADTNTEAV